jgi:hypothetical protein
MLKKLTLLGMSVAALLALAAPAAQATGPLVTNAAGEAAKSLTARSTNTTTTTVAGTLECTTVNMNISTVTSNANTTIHGHGTATAEGTPKAIGHAENDTGHCGSSSGSVVEITGVTVSTIHLTKHGTETTGTATFSYTYDLRSATGAGLIAECTFGGTVPVKKTGTSTLNVEGKITKTAGSAFCPGEGTLKGDFTVFDETGAAATVH